MKMPIAWHRECLANMESHLAREEQSYARCLENLRRLRDDIELRAQQIREASRRGLDGFDADKLLKSRGVK